MGNAVAGHSGANVIESYHVHESMFDTIFSRCGMGAFVKKTGIAILGLVSLIGCKERIWGESSTSENISSSNEQLDLAECRYSARSLYQRKILGEDRQMPPHIFETNLKCIEKKGDFDVVSCFSVIKLLDEKKEKLVYIFDSHDFGTNSLNMLITTTNGKIDNGEGGSIIDPGGYKVEHKQNSIRLSDKRYPYFLERGWQNEIVVQIASPVKVSLKRTEGRNFNWPVTFSHEFTSCSPEQ